MIKQQIKLLILLPFFSLLLFATSQKAHAFSLNDVVNGVKNGIDTIKNIIIPQDKNLSVTSKIDLTPNGDLDKDGKVDAGDTVRFSYTLTNKSEKKYSFATLNTNINRQQINFVHNVVGTANLNDDGKTITIPNLSLVPDQVINITFDARVNYTKNSDPLLSTEPELIDDKKQSIIKAEKYEIKVKRKSGENIQGMIEEINISKPK